MSFRNARKALGPLDEAPWEEDEQGRRYKKIASGRWYPDDEEYRDEALEPQQYSNDGPSAYGLHDEVRSYDDDQLRSPGDPYTVSLQTFDNGEPSQSFADNREDDHAGAEQSSTRGVLDVIKSDPDKHDKDSKFKRIRSEKISSFFKEGRVLAVVWVEPSAQSSSHSTSEGFSAVRFGATAHAEIRRFIVVKNHGKFHSTCIPIQTYRGAGARDRSDAREHAIAYTSTIPPEPVPGESITRRPIKIVARKGEQLDQRSRINFSKLYTIEHNVKVKDIGEVPPEWMSWVNHYYSQTNGIDRSRFEDEADGKAQEVNG